MKVFPAGVYLPGNVNAMGCERLGWNVRRPTGGFVAAVLALTMFAVFVATLLGRCWWTSSDRTVIVVVGAGEVLLCIRELWHDSPVPSAGWTLKWGPFRPHFRWTVIGYPGERWIVLPLIVPLSLAVLGYLPFVTMRMRLRKRIHACARCGYDLFRLGSSICPECGSRLEDVPVGSD